MFQHGNRAAKLMAEMPTLISPIARTLSQVHIFVIRSFTFRQRFAQHLLKRPVRLAHVVVQRGNLYRFQNRWLINPARNLG